jgi:GMP synthase-like glutamine amidotransferase
MRVIVIRHHREDSAGFVADAFAARGADVSTHLFPQDGPLPAADGADHIVLLGASFSVNDDGQLAGRVAAELDWLRQADRAGVPVLGICYGAQALTAALGGRVEAAAKEIGWQLVESLDGELIPAGPWLEFHGDWCLPPPGARLLARSELGVQAFSVGPHLAVQFHPEVDGAQLRRWLDAGGQAEAERAGQDAERLLARTVAEEPAARLRADQVVGAALRIAGQQ